MDIRRFQKKIFSHYEEKGRDLPWRRTKDPYKILLSEIMLQQTQVDRVIDYYKKWTKKWPAVKKLANASRKDILKAWMGLGYNNRAINLHKTAKIISDHFKGNIINAVQNHEILPGIGPYTSAAVQIFAKNADIVTIDTNIRRVLMHEFNIMDDKVPEMAKKCLPKGKSRIWHNALMDYGQILSSRKTGIKPKTQQTKFEGSDRQVRARIMRLLLKKSHSFTELKDSLTVKTSRLNKIIEKMLKEKVIKEKNKRYSI
ncbi:Fe-S cluster assembly protein HesB [Candidatus Woesearchaeota archaeon]|nr:Fe-S cluster assembly protein HesB [Candidatus Woesearchaeota archaeon]